MKRGFKADAERRSISARVSLELSTTAPLCPWAFAKALGVMVFGADELDLEAEHADQLLQRDLP